MDELLDTDALIHRFTFKRRERPLPAELRPLWRLSVLAMILDRCREKRASLEQLHVLNWAIRNQKSRTVFLEYLDGNRKPDEVIVRYDPSLTRAVELALYEGIVERNEAEISEGSQGSNLYRITLSERGKQLVTEIDSMNDCLTAEKNFLKAFGRNISQADITGLLNWSKN